MTPVKLAGSISSKGDDQKVVWAEFSTLSLAVFVIRVIPWHTQGPHALIYNGKLSPGFVLLA
jgi:hypothetical protein